MPINLLPITGTLGNSLKTMEISLQASPKGCESSMDVNCIDQKLLTFITKTIESTKIITREKVRNKENDAKVNVRAKEFGQKDILEIEELKYFDALPKWKEEKMDVVCQSIIQPSMISIFGNSSLGMTCIFAENFINSENDISQNPFRMWAFSNLENQKIQIILFILGIFSFLKLMVMFANDS